MCIGSSARRNHQRIVLSMEILVHFMISGRGEMFRTVAYSNEQGNRRSTSETLTRVKVQQRYVAIIIFVRETMGRSLVML